MKVVVEFDEVRPVSEISKSRIVAFSVPALVALHCYEHDPMTGFMPSPFDYG